MSKRPDWLEALIDLGIAQWRTGDGDSAKSSFMQAIARHPQSTDALRALGAVAVERATQLWRWISKPSWRNSGTIPELDYNVGVAAGNGRIHRRRRALLPPRDGREARFRRSPAELGEHAQGPWPEEEAKTYWQQAVEAKPELAEKYF